MISLVAVFAIAWLLVLLGVIVIFEFIVPFQFCSCFYDSVAKGVFATVLSVAWLFALVLMRNVLVRRTLLSKRVPSN